MGKKDLHRKITNFKGHSVVVPENDQIMSYIAMDFLHLNKDEMFSLGNDEREVGLVFLSGDCIVKDNFSAAETFITGRSDPFETWPHAVYIPAGAYITLKANSELVAVIFSTFADKGGSIEFVRPEELDILKIGEGNWYLEGTFVMYNNVKSKRLIVGETHIPAGNWCSSPPHSHDKDVKGEQTKLEEIYYFKFKPSQGFGFQGVYTLDNDINEAYIIRNNEVVLVPKGMHPNVAGPGYEMYMLWGMAGPKKEWVPFEDPDHSWLGSVKAAKK